MEYSLFTIGFEYDIVQMVAFIRDTHLKSIYEASHYFPALSLQLLGV